MGLPTCVDRSVFVHILICMFGTSSWLAVNGIWVELPLLVQKLPEQWTLPSYMSVVIQLANIGPISYTLISIFAPFILSHEKVIILFILMIGASSCLLLSFFWEYTTFIAGTQHSTALLILEFFLALVDCTSSVAFFPFIANFKEKYMTSYFIGEGLSGLLPGLVALGQGVGVVNCINITKTNFTNGSWINTTGNIFPQYQQPNFPAQDFFLFLFIITFMSGFAFTLLGLMPQFRSEMSLNNNVCELVYSRKDSELTSSATVTTSIDSTLSPCNCTESVNNGQSVSHLLNQDDKISDDECQEYKLASRSIKPKISPSLYAYLLLLTATINGISNGILPAIQSYASLPYGNKPFSFSVLFGIIANPLACFLAYFFPTKNIIYITVLTILGCSVAGYDLTLAGLSPNPFLRGKKLGEILLVLSWILVTGFFSYVKVCIGVIFRTQGRRGLLWYGVVTQAGSAVGSIIMFVLVNVLKLFTSAPMC